MFVARRPRKPVARQHRKLPVKQVNNLSKNTISKLARPLHVSRISAGVYGTVREILRAFLKHLTRQAVNHLFHKKTLTPMHVKTGMERFLTYSRDTKM